MTSLFDAIELEDRTNQTGNRKAVVLANHRVDDRLGSFIKAASTSDERKARLELVQDDLESIVAGACQEIGSGDPAKIAAQIRERLSASCPCGAKEVCDCGGTQRTASVHEARKPKMCPYHSEVVDISLAQGEPQSGYTAMAQHAWGENHCAGGWEGRCNFKPAMTTQTFWDDKAEKAQERRLEREQEIQRQQEAEETIQPLDEVDDEGNVELEDAGVPVEGISEAPDSGGGEVLQFPSDAVTEAPEATPEAAVPMAMAASADDRAPLDGQPRSKTAELEKLAPGKQHLPGASPKRNRQYEHIKQSCLEGGKSEDECKELAARTVNKQRSEHGETKSHSIHASITHNSWGNPGDGYNDILEEEGEGYDPGAICPTCGGPGVPLGQLGHRSHFRCRNCGLDFSEHPGQLPERGAASAQGDQLGPIKRVKVDEGSDTPIPKIDKRKWTPENVTELDADGSDGSHPTERQDILDTHTPTDRESLDQIGEQVTEHQDVTEGSEQSHSGQGGTFPKGNQAKPVTSANETTCPDCGATTFDGVCSNPKCPRSHPPHAPSYPTSAKLQDDVDRNPLQSLIEGGFDGFPPEAEVQRAISAYRQ